MSEYDDVVERASTLVIVALTTLVSFAAYAAIGYFAAWLIGWGPTRRVVAGAGFSLGLFALAWCFEKVSPMSSYGSPSGFIRIKLGWHHLWFAPGFLLVRRMR